MTEVYLSLGSNMGDRKLNLETAVRMTDQLPGTKVTAKSEVVESKADGFEGADFLNCCIRIETSLEAEKLLDALKGIERSLGRTNEGIHLDSEGKRIYSDRPVDIDILLYGREKINTERLTVPHPAMEEREFVMVPLRQILEKSNY